MLLLFLLLLKLEFQRYASQCGLYPPDGDILNQQRFLFIQSSIPVYSSLNAHFYRAMLTKFFRDSSISAKTCIIRHDLVYHEHAAAGIQDMKMLQRNLEDGHTLEHPAKSFEMLWTEKLALYIR